MPASASDPTLNAPRTWNEFHKKDFGKKESEAWRKERWKAYQDRVVENNKKSAKLADGWVETDQDGLMVRGAQDFYKKLAIRQKRWPIRNQTTKNLNRCFAWQY